MEPLQTFGNTAKGLARNPIGIIALFIVLIYGFASLVVGFSGNLSATERQPIVWFLVVFPVVVLSVFTWLVSKHHTKLYAPSDYQADDAFIRASQASFEAAVSIGAAGAKWASQSTEGGISTDEVDRLTKETANSIVRASRRAQAGARQKRVLWVDDRPHNNVFERRALESLGLQITLATSTDEALVQLSQSQFDVIVSDMGRPSDPRAGYTLLNALRSKGNATPFIIYAGSKAPEHLAEAKEKGAQGCTNRPDELFGMVLHAVDLD